MRVLRFLTIAVLSTIALASSGAAQTVIPLTQFRSVELHDGGQVFLRHGSTQRVTVLSRDLRCTRVQVADGQRLVILNRVGECPRNHQLQIEVITPEIAAISVSDGGTVQSLGAFPVQGAIDANVEQGGTIDIRAIPADVVDASVDSGGRIFTNPRKTLAATVVSGGIITYWGDVHVKRSVRDGGVVARGTLADADKPLSELSPHSHVIAPIPPIPPVPPVPPLRNDGW
jgi:uncharacterized ubiquitin-like protein YukD